MNVVEHLLNVFTFVAQAGHFILAAQFALIFQPAFKAVFGHLMNYGHPQGHIFMAFRLIV